MGGTLAGFWVSMRLEAHKYHRCYLNASQVTQYGLSDVLSTDKLWWDAISIPRRSVSILDVGGGATTAVLICEDLARLDEVAEVLRYVGPSFVIALLLDGPQLATRWSSRYAGVLADDPGSAVLTLTSLGMAIRSQHAGASGSRVIALWKDPERGLREIELASGSGSRCPLPRRAEENGLDGRRALPHRNDPSPRPRRSPSGGVGRRRVSEQSRNRGEK